MGAWICSFMRRLRPERVENGVGAGLEECVERLNGRMLPGSFSRDRLHFASHSPFREYRRLYLSQAAIDE
jgi:hypothetical protein